MLRPEKTALHIFSVRIQNHVACFPCRAQLKRVLGSKWTIDTPWLVPEVESARRPVFPVTTIRNCYFYFHEPSSHRASFNFYIFTFGSTFRIERAIATRRLNSPSSVSLPYQIHQTAPYAWRSHSSAHCTVHMYVSLKVSRDACLG